jgi:hypothetical protein
LVEVHLLDLCSIVFAGLPVMWFTVFFFSIVRDTAYGWREKFRNVVKDAVAMEVEM